MINLRMHLWMDYYLILLICLEQSLMDLLILLGLKEWMVTFGGDREGGVLSSCS